MDYKKIYENLIKKAKIRTINKLTYYEKHHIIPKCLGGSEIIENIVLLTPEEHYIAHQLLIKIYPNNEKLLFAALLMCTHNSDKRITNKIYGWIKRRLSNISSKSFKQIWDNYSDEEYSSHCKNMKWKKERYKKQKQIMKERYENPEFYSSFVKTMTLVNKDPAKRKKAGKKIKENWKYNKDFKEKMKNRKKRGSDGSALKKKWEDPNWRNYMLECRKRKKNET
jgi:hypothetical protein